MEDELLMSFLIRLAYVNGFATVSGMEQVLFPGYRPAIGTLYLHDGYRILDALQDTCGITDTGKLLSMTPYQYVTARQPDKKQAALAEYMLNDPRMCNVPSIRMRGIGPKTLKYCPICAMQEIREYGFYWLHVSQNLADSTACQIHGVLLRETVPLNDRRGEHPHMIPDGGLVLTYAEHQEAEAYMAEKHTQVKEGTVSLQTVTCGDCGRTYAAHPYSVKSGMPCPYCGNHLTPAASLQRRLDLLGKGDYRVSGKGASGADSEKTISVTHTPCGTVSAFRLISSLIWEDEPVCKGCSSRRDPAILQKRFDPEEKEFRFLPLLEEDIARHRLNVVHTPCGKNFHPSAAGFLNDKTARHCPYCHEIHPTIHIEDIDPSYEIVKRESSNLKPMIMRHKDCGTIFSVMKGAFHAGARCPLCTPWITFEDLRSEVESWSEGTYSVRKAVIRGYADIIRCNPNEEVIGTATYRACIADMERTDHRYFRGIGKAYTRPLSDKRFIYDAVKAAQEDHGCWSYRMDGFIPGVDKDRIQIKRIMRKMVDEGYLKRKSSGRFVTDNSMVHVSKTFGEAGGQQKEKVKAVDFFEKRGGAFS